MSDSEPNPPDLEKLFREMRDDGLTEHEVATVVEGVRARIRGGSGGGGGLGSASFRPWIAAGVLLAVTGGGALLWHRSNVQTNARGASPPAASPTALPLASPTMEERTTGPLTEGDSEDEEAVSAAPAPRRTRRPARSRADESETPGAVPEHVLLSEARQALPSDPSRALSLAEAHRRQYSSGLLAPEREIIAIDALLALGRETDARERALRVVRRWPGSSHAARLVARNLVRSNEEE